jgi:thymidylate synthase
MRNKTLYTFRGNSADDVWRSAATCIREDGEIQLGRGGSTLEIYPSVLQITDPRQRLVYGRPINTAYGIAELIWNISGGKRATFLEFWNSQISQYVGDSEGVTDSAYGFRLGVRPKLSDFAATFMGSDWQDSRTDQVLASYRALCAAPDSRQIVLQLWETERDIPNPSPQQEVPCIVFRQLLQRDGQ